MAPWVLQVEPQANERHFSQSVLVQQPPSPNDLTGIMIGDGFTVEELLFYSISQWDAIDDGVMGGRWRSGVGVVFFCMG